MTLVVVFIVAAVVVTGIFVVIFTRDATRADRVVEDTDRVDPQSDGQAPTP